MIYRHKYLSGQFLSNKSIHKVTGKNPLVVVLSNSFTFMNDLLLNTLRINRIYYQISWADEASIMAYNLPAIAFKNHFLTQQALVEFIADLMLDRQTFSDLTQRKCIARQQYRKWFQIIKEENQGLCRYSNLKSSGIYNQQDYHNSLFNQLLTLASWIKSDVLERKYQSYQRNQVNFQNLLIYDIIKSILRLCQLTKVDHILRAHFENLLQFQQEFEKRIQNQLKLEEENFGSNQIQIVTDRVQQNSLIQFPTFKLNAKRFTVVFTIMAAIYIKWAE